MPKRTAKSASNYVLAKEGLYMTQDQQKCIVAQAAVTHVPSDTVIGVGTGSTANYFIEALTEIKHSIEGAVASSVATADRLKQIGIEVLPLNSVASLSVYIDGADEVDAHGRMIKGGGGALTQEKIVAQVAKSFVCIVDASKQVEVLGKAFPLPIEVIPMARSFVARELVKLGGDPEYRDGFVTDNGNHIIDVFHLDIVDPLTLEQQLNAIPGIVCHGLFAQRGADVVLSGQADGQVLTQNLG